MVTMYEPAAQDLRAARNLFRAYFRNKDYANAERVLSYARHDLEKAGKYHDGFLNPLGEFLAPEDEFSARTKVINAFLKSIKTYEILGDEQNASLVRKRLTCYMERTSGYVTDRFKSELRQMVKSVEYDDLEAARGHLAAGRFYFSRGDLGNGSKEAHEPIDRLEKSLERFEELKGFKEDMKRSQMIKIEMLTSTPDKSEGRHRFIEFLERKREQLREMFKH